MFHAFAAGGHMMIRGSTVLGKPFSQAITSARAGVMLGDLSIFCFFLGAAPPAPPSMRLTPPGITRATQCEVERGRSARP